MNRLLAMSFDDHCNDDRVFPNRLDPLDRIISTLLDGLTWGAISTTPRVAALGVVSTSCHRHDSHAMMLVFFPNSLDLLDWIISNLLDGFLSGAISTTSMIVAPGQCLLLSLWTWMIVQQSQGKYEYRHQWQIYYKEKSTCFYNISILYYTFLLFFSYRLGFQEVFAELLFRAVCSRTLCEYL
jgi:hypothetical protein